jgi:hypothetical protein
MNEEQGDLPYRTWSPPDTSARDNQIKRIACLRAAVDYHGQDGHPAYKYDDVLWTANRFVEWVDK